MYIFLNSKLFHLNSVQSYKYENVNKQFFNRSFHLKNTRSYFRSSTFTMVDRFYALHFQVQVFLEEANLMLRKRRCKNAARNAIDPEKPKAR